MIQVMILCIHALFEQWFYETTVLCTVDMLSLNLTLLYSFLDHFLEFLAINKTTIFKLLKECCGNVYRIKVVLR